MKKIREWIHGQGRRITLLILVVLGIGMAVHYFVVERNGQWGVDMQNPTATPKSREEQNLGGDKLSPVTLKETQKPKSTRKTETKDRTITLGFAGDICLDDSCAVMRNMRKQGGLDKVISPKLISKMKSFDAMVINNEFSISSTGKPMEGKAYTFRSKPSNVKYLKQLGTDVAGLANNHVFDYGKKAFLDTLSHLKQAGIQTVGAGKNSKEAQAPVFLDIKGKKIAIVAATRAEKYIMTPEATKNSAGVFRTYQPAKYVKEIKRAKEKADYVIAYVHWGTEYSTTLEKAQITQAKAYIRAGADAVIGAHTHCMQGVGYYKNKPVFYSLGNFWFNEKTLYTTVVRLDIAQNGAVTVRMLPCIQKNKKTKILTKEKQIKKFMDYVNRISTNAELVYKNADRCILVRKQ